MKTISAIVITKNEEMHIESCIKCLQPFADEVIIFDSMSTDRTGEIATSLGAKFIPEPIFPGYGPQRIKAQKHASCDFIFFLDSDERVTPELAAEIKEFVANAKAKRLKVVIDSRSFTLSDLTEIKEHYFENISLLVSLPLT